MGIRFLACRVLPDKKRYSSCLYWCQFVCDVDGKTQRLKATVPDRRVWLPTPECVMVQITHYTRLNYTNHPQVNIHWIHCIQNFSTFKIFTQLTLSLKNRVCPEIFHCIEYIFYHSGCLSNFALAVRKQSMPWNFSLCWINFFILDIRATCAWPEKQGVPEFTVLNWLYISYHSGCSSNFALALETRVLKFFTWLNIFFTIQHFWETLRLSRKTECALNSLYWIHIFHHSRFLSTCSEKQSCSEISHCIENIIFIIQGFWATCACSEK